MKKWTQEEDNLVKEFYCKIPVKELQAKLIKYSLPAIWSRANSLGLSIPMSLRKRKYNIDENYFENIDSEEKAYWIGFLMADGCVYICPKGRHTLKIHLAIKDKNHLEKFGRSIKSNQPIKISQTKEGHVYVEGFYCNKKMCKDLIKLGCIPRKTFNLQFPNLEKDLIRHFLRGYFDGDGSVFKIKSKYNQLGCKFIGQKDFLEKVNNILNSLEIFRPICEGKGCSYIKMQSVANNKAIYNYMYKDATIYLERKKDRFEEWLNACNCR